MTAFFGHCLQQNWFFHTAKATVCQVCPDFSPWGTPGPTDPRSPECGGAGSREGVLPLFILRDVRSNIRVPCGQVEELAACRPSHWPLHDDLPLPKKLSICLGTRAKPFVPLHGHKEGYADKKKKLGNYLESLSNKIYSIKAGNKRKI